MLKIFLAFSTFLLGVGRGVHTFLASELQFKWPGYSALTTLETLNFILYV